MSGEYEAEKRELVEVAVRAAETRLQAGSGGNISVRVRGKEGLFLIKPSGTCLRDLRPEELLLLNLQGEVVTGNASLNGVRPSKDTMTHAGIYRIRPEVMGILHVHATWALAFAMEERSIPLLTEEAIDKIGTIPMVPCAPGKLSQRHEEVAAQYEDLRVKVVMLAKHGIIAAGKTLKEAAELLELTNESAKLAWLLEIRKAALSVSDGSAFWPLV